MFPMIIRFLFLLSFLHISFSLTQICSSPLLKQNYNEWAPYLNISLIAPAQFGNLNICSYLNNNPSCCDSNTMSYYKEMWDIFKDYFNIENKKIMEILSSKVEYAYENRDQIISIYKSMNSTLNATNSQLNSIREQNITSSLRDVNDNTTIDINEIIKNLNKSFDLNLSDSNYNKIKIGDYFNWTENISNDLLQNTDDIIQSDYFNNLDNMDENLINEEINKTQVRYLDFVKERTKCFSSVFRHFASLICLSCEPEFESNGIFLNAKHVHINLSMDSCLSFGSDCYGYLKAGVEMNKNALFFANIDSLNSTANNFTTLSANQLNEYFSSVTNLYNFFSGRQNSIIDSLKKNLLFSMPEKCNSPKNCSWICLNYLTSTGLDFKKILNGTSVSIDNLNSFNVGILGFNNRILQKMPINSSTLSYNGSFLLNTYEKATTTGLNFTIDGSGGVILFEKKEGSNHFNNISYSDKINTMEIFILFLFFFVCIIN